MLSLFILYGMILEAAGVFQSESCDMTLTSVFVNFVNFLSHFCDLTVFLKVFSFLLYVFVDVVLSVYMNHSEIKNPHMFIQLHTTFVCAVYIYIYMIKN